MTAPVNGHVRPRLSSNEIAWSGWCPFCGQPAMVWGWVEHEARPHPGHRQRLRMDVLVTDVVHTEAYAECIGVPRDRE